MSGLLAPTVPFVMLATLWGIAGTILIGLQRREATKNVTHWATLVIVFALVFAGFIVALILHLSTPPW